MTDQLVLELTEAEARDLTDRIKRAVEHVWELFLEAHERRAWMALAYKSWRDWAQAEFQWSKSHSYRLLDQGRVIRELETATGISPIGEIVNEYTARDLKPHLDVVIEQIKAAVVDTEPEMRVEAAKTAVTEMRKWLRQSKTPHPIKKSDTGNGTRHPARYTADLIPLFVEFLEEGWAVLDPFAGTGKIHELRNFINVETAGVEIEKDWADLWEWTFHGDALDTGFASDSFDAIVTSPTYGNRLADNHEAYDPEARRSYRHDLGRPLDPNNSGQLQWGQEYRDFHVKAWLEATRVLRPGGIFVLNIKDHIRAGKRQAVSAWHAATILGLGYDLVDCVPFTVTGLLNGANHLARLDAELVWVFRKATA